MDGWWDTKALDQLIYKLYISRIDKKKTNLPINLDMYKSRLLNLQSKIRSQKVAEEHYDLGNDMYSKMLGGSMQYTCAYWKQAETLDEAQENKLELICKKLQLKEGRKSPGTRLRLGRFCETCGRKIWRSG